MPSNAGVDILAPECAAPVNGKLANITAVREARDKYYETSRDEDRDVELINRSTVPVRKSAESSPETAGAGKEGLSASLKEIYDAVLEMKQGEVDAHGGGGNRQGHGRAGHPRRGADRRHG